MSNSYAPAAPDFRPRTVRSPITRLGLERSQIAVTTTMPTNPRKPCRIPGCVELLATGETCPIHPPERAPDTRNTAARRGYDARWQRTTARNLRTHPRCAWCGNPADLTDHVIPRALGGTDHPSNLQSLCRTCHARKTAQERARHRST